MFLCKECKGVTRVLSTRLTPDGVPRRRYVCLSCGIRFSTLEVLAQQSGRTLKTQKEDGLLKARKTLDTLLNAIVSPPPQEQVEQESTGKNKDSL